jgi:hypothetical protein
VGRAARLKGATLEDRIANAKQRAADETARIKARLQLIAEQEILAVRTMVWWQLDMSVQRMDQKQKRHLDMGMLAATIYGIMGGLLNGYRHQRTTGFGTVRHNGKP